MCASHKRSAFFEIETVFEARELVFPHLYMFVTIISAVDTKVNMVLNAKIKTKPVNLLLENIKKAIVNKNLPMKKRQPRPDNEAIMQKYNR